MSHRWLTTYSFKFTCVLFIGSLLFHMTLSKIPNTTEVHFLNVGQGDASLIVTSQLHTVLIDGGPGEVVLEELGEVLPFFVRDIDLMVLTHPHRDHVEGLIEVLNRYDVRHVLLAGDEYGSSLYREFLKRVRQESAARKTQIHFAYADNDILIPLASRSALAEEVLLLDVLYPISPIVGKEFENTNNASVVMRMSQDERTFLFAGDCEKECEEELLEYYPQNKLKSDVLKIGHHGSRTSTSPQFLQTISPMIAVIQSGVDNQFEHPHLETLTKLQKTGVQIRRNDLEGRITLSVNSE